MSDYMRLAEQDKELAQVLIFNGKGDLMGHHGVNGRRIFEANGGSAVYRRDLGRTLVEFSACDFRNVPLDRRVVRIIRTELQSFGDTASTASLTFEGVQAGIEHMANENQVDPRADWFDKLDWDELDRWAELPKRFGAEDNPYNQAVLSMIFRAIAGRQRHPGTKFDYLIVLNGKQGIGKTRAVQAIGGEYYAQAPVLRSLRLKQEFMEETAGAIVVEMAELAGLRSVDNSLIKGFLSSGSDKARLSYAESAAELPRTWIMIGTANHFDAAYDSSGYRRFPIVQCNEAIDVAWLKENRDQLIAQGKALGGNLYLPDDLQAQVEIVAQELRPKTREEEVLEELYSGRATPIPANELRQDLRQSGIFNHQPRRIMEIMQTLGFSKTRRAGGWFWISNAKEKAAQEAK